MACRAVSWLCGVTPAQQSARTDSGTSGSAREILSLLLEKNPSVRIVATTVSLESAAEFTACMKDFTFAECVQLQISKARPIGSYHLMTGQNPIYIFTLQNGEEPV